MQKDQVTIHVSPKNEVIVHRALFGHTEKDLFIEKLPIPKYPLWLRTIIGMIRWYQRNVSHKLGNRCVFDPSCSHYAELAFRKKGCIKGLIETIKRLHRCKPENGGIDDLV